MLIPKRWRLVAEYSEADALAQSLPVSPVLCRLLANRGIRTLDAAERFLNPDLDAMHAPCLMDGLVEGVEQVMQALERKEKIFVHGDYDVDGITSTVLMVRVLRLLGADVSWYVPHRQREGYDLGICGVEEAHRRGASLILTVDCGTSAALAVERARELGIYVIVTDHHALGHEVSRPDVLVNPKKPGCPYPFKELAGVGVAYKFAEELVRRCDYDVEVYRRRFCDLAAIGTVADVVSLIDENRTLVKFGLEELPRTGKKGLRALLDVSRVSAPVTSYMLAFGVSPRLNAAGRLDDAGLAVELLLTNDEAEAVELAGRLDALNKERQAEQERVVNEALAHVDREQLHEKAKVLVLSSQGWHPGVVGIVASKIAERYHRPSILISLDEAGAGVGSARSIGSFDVFDALMQCRHLLERCGGHAYAAGLSISAENLGSFSEEINRIADEVMSESDLLPQIDVDMELDASQITRELAHELALLEPHGHGNKQPLFVSRGMRLSDKTRMGASGAHLRLKFEGGIECVAFGWGDREEAFQLGSSFDVCYNIQINRWNGT
ncbi:MAG: single-stranded-DNA-specific exonuclease RecJ, partial [Armatimonadota bacterium]